MIAWYTINFNARRKRQSITRRGLECNFWMKLLISKLLNDKNRKTNRHWDKSTKQQSFLLSKTTKTLNNNDEFITFSLRFCCKTTSIDWRKELPFKRHKEGRGKQRRMKKVLRRKKKKAKFIKWKKSLNDSRKIKKQSDEKRGSRFEGTRRKISRA